MYPAIKEMFGGARSYVTAWADVGYLVDQSIMVTNSMRRVPDTIGDKFSDNIGGILPSSLGFSLRDFYNSNVKLLHLS